MTWLRRRMIEDMQLRGLSASTQENYVSAGRQLAEYYGKSPACITEEELRKYFLYLKNVKCVSRSTSTVALCAIKFLYQHTLRRIWPTLDLVRPPQEKKLPVVLSVAEVRRILACLRLLCYRACLSTIYACGLRVSEAVRIQVRDIDSDRMLVHVRNGKGTKDRYVPLPQGSYGARIGGDFSSPWSSVSRAIWRPCARPTSTGHAGHRTVWHRGLGWPCLHLPGLRRGPISVPFLPKPALPQMSKRTQPTMVREATRPALARSLLLAHLHPA